jgi:hypothetical protein
VIFSTNEVAIDPATLDVVNVIVNNEGIHGIDELKVTQIGKQIGLHYR